MVTEMAGFKQYVSSTQINRPVVYSFAYILLISWNNFRRTSELLYEVGLISEENFYDSSFIILLKRHAIKFYKFPNIRTSDCEDHTTLSLTCKYLFLGPTWCVGRPTPVRWMWIVLMCWPVLEPLSTRYLIVPTYTSIYLYFICVQIFSQFRCHNKEKSFCFQNILIINKLLYFNPGHNFLSCSCFVDLYRYKAVS